MSQYSANRDEGFYESDIMKLTLKCNEIMEKDGAYFTVFE